MIGWRNQQQEPPDIPPAGPEELPPDSLPPGIPPAGPLEVPAAPAELPPDPMPELPMPRDVIPMTGDGGRSALSDSPFTA